MGSKNVTEKQQQEQMDVLLWWPTSQKRRKSWEQWKRALMSDGNEQKELIFALYWNDSYNGENVDDIQPFYDEHPHVWPAATSHVWSPGRSLSMPSLVSRFRNKEKSFFCVSYAYSMSNPAGKDFSLTSSHLQLSASGLSLLSGTSFNTTHRTRSWSPAWNAVGQPTTPPWGSWDSR